MRIASVSHVVFAAIMIAIGIGGLIKGDFTPVSDPIPQDSHALAYLCSFISLTTGIGLLWQRTSAAAARVLFASLLLWLLLLRVPNIILSPTFGVFWPAFRLRRCWRVPGYCMHGSLLTGTGSASVSPPETRPPHREGALRRGTDLLRLCSFLRSQGYRLAGARLVAVACGLGLFHWRCLHCGGRGGAHRRVCTAGSRTLGVADGHVHAAGVGTHRSGRFQRRLPMERDFRFCGAHGWCLGGCGFCTPACPGSPWTSASTGCGRMGPLPGTGSIDSMSWVVALPVKLRLVPVRPAHAMTDARISRAPSNHPMRPSPSQSMDNFAVRSD